MAPVTPSKVEESQVFGLVLGTVVGRLREQRGWTQSMLAEKVGVSQPVMSRIEAGKAQPDAFMYGRIAAALGLQVHDLERQVREGMDRTKRAAEAVTGKKPWEEALGLAGAVGLVGLIAFAVAAMLGDEPDGGGGKAKGRPPKK
ncbi:MAG: helix-turn-helix domain-containing protein [Myxococcaceae bacterium]